MDEMYMLLPDWFGDGGRRIYLFKNPKRLDALCLKKALNQWNRITEIKNPEKVKDCYYSFEFLWKMARKIIPREEEKEEDGQRALRLFQVLAYFPRDLIGLLNNRCIVKNDDIFKSYASISTLRDWGLVFCESEREWAIDEKLPYSATLMTVIRDVNRKEQTEKDVLIDFLNHIQIFILKYEYFLDVWMLAMDYDDLVKEHNMIQTSLYWICFEHEKQCGLGQKALLKKTFEKGTELVLAEHQSDLSMLMKICEMKYILNCQGQDSTPETKWIQLGQKCDYSDAEIEAFAEDTNYCRVLDSCYYDMYDIAMSEETSDEYKQKYLNESLRMLKIIFKVMCDDVSYEMDLPRLIKEMLKCLDGLKRMNELPALVQELDIIHRIEVSLTKQIPGFHWINQAAPWIQVIEQIFVTYVEQTSAIDAHDKKCVLEILSSSLEILYKYHNSLFEMYPLENDRSYISENLSKIVDLYEKCLIGLGKDFEALKLIEENKDLRVKYCTDTQP